jgi:hypothetical protein
VRPLWLCAFVVGFFGGNMGLERNYRAQHKGTKAQRRLDKDAALASCRQKY